MDKETFCEMYCPVPVHYHDVDNPKDQWADCDMDEDTECPFRNVEFAKVTEGPGRHQDTKPSPPGFKEG